MTHWNTVLANASQLMAADADHDAREHLQNMREERARAERDEGPEPDAADWYGRPEPITPALKARADAEWLAMPQWQAGGVGPLNAPTRIDLPPVLPGWTDPRLKRAHALIEEVFNTFPPNCESDAANLVRQLLDDVEAADCALGGG